MSAVVEASRLGKRYGRRWALSDCTLAIPAGRVVGLVGPNGAGKTTLLQLAAGLLAPDAGTIKVLGARPADTTAQLDRVGFVAQDAPLYAGLSVAGHLRMGAWLNPGWDSELAARRLGQLDLQPRQRAGSLSGGQRAPAVVLAVTGPHLAHAYDTLASCKLRGDCATARSAFPPPGYGGLENFAGILTFGVPGLIGMFWGAPLAAREFETGTFRLAWTQGVTRVRWLAIKIAVVGAAGMVVAGLLSLMVTWWTAPFWAVYTDRLTPAQFGASGIAPIGYAAFGFALGVAAGLLIRRTLPAMVVTMVIFTAVQVGFPLFVRPHLIAPVTTASALNVASLTEMGIGPGGSLVVSTQPAVPGAWIFSSQIITPAGRPASSEPATSACGYNSTGQGCDAYVARLHLRQTVTYQPASRYWALQWYETAIFIVLALILAGCCLWWIGRHQADALSIRRPRASERTPALRSST